MCGQTYISTFKKRAAENFFLKTGGSLVTPRSVQPLMGKSFFHIKKEIAMTTTRTKCPAPRPSALFRFLFCAVLSVCAVHAVGAQSTHSNAVLRLAQPASVYFKVTRWDKWRLELPLGVLLDPGYQRAKLMVGFRAAPKLELLIGAAYGLGAESLMSFSAKKIDQKFYETSLGLRFYYRESQAKKRNHYLEAQIAYLPERFFRANDWYYNHNSYRQFGSAVATKASYRVDFHFGKQRPLTHNLYLNWHLGLSIRAKNIQHTALEETFLDNKPLAGSIMRPFDRKEGWSVGATPVVGLALSWQPLTQTVRYKH